MSREPGELTGRQHIADVDHRVDDGSEVIGVGDAVEVGVEADDQRRLRDRGGAGRHLGGERGPPGLVHRRGDLGDARRLARVETRRLGAQPVGTGETEARAKTARVGLASRDRGDGLCGLADGLRQTDGLTDLGLTERPSRAALGSQPQGVGGEAEHADKTSVVDELADLHDFTVDSTTDNA